MSQLSCLALRLVFAACASRIIGGYSFAVTVPYVFSWGISGCWPGFAQTFLYPGAYWWRCVFNS